MRIPYKTFKALYDSIQEYVHEYTLDDKIAKYGYITAYLDFGLITPEEAEEIRKLLELEVELVEDLQV